MCKVMAEHISACVPHNALPLMHYQMCIIYPRFRNFDWFAQCPGKLHNALLDTGVFKRCKYMCFVHTMCQQIGDMSNTHILRMIHKVAHVHGKVVQLFSN